MFCGKCGFENVAGAAVCGNCGEVLQNFNNQIPAQAPYQQPVYQQPTYQQSVYQATAQQTIPEGYSETVSVGEWVGAMFLLCIPIVNFILIFVWAFGNSKKSKANYFKACLLIALVSAILSVIFLFVMALITGGFYF